MRKFQKVWVSINLKQKILGNFEADAWSSFYNITIYILIIRQHSIYYKTWILLKPSFSFFSYQAPSTNIDFINLKTQLKNITKVK